MNLRNLICRPVAAIALVICASSCGKNEEAAKERDLAIEQAKIAHAKKDTAEIAAAVKAYYIEYGKYPVRSPNGDVAIGNDSDELFKILIATPGHEMNPRKVVFLSTEKPNDPWGSRYMIGIDADYNNHIDAKIVGYSDVDAEMLKAGVMVWSYGRDGKPGTNGDAKFTGSDDVASW
jgi:hypothetical protein